MLALGLRDSRLRAAGSPEGAWLRDVCGPTKAWRQVERDGRGGASRGVVSASGRMLVTPPDRVGVWRVVVTQGAGFEEAELEGRGLKRRTSRGVA